MQLVDQSEAPADRAGSVDRVIAQRMLSALGSPPVQLLLWNGETVTARDDPPLLTLRIADRLTLLRLIIDPEMQFGEAYMAGRISCVSGDLVQGLEAVFRSGPLMPDSHWLGTSLARAARFLRRNTLQGSRRNIRAHYDLGNDFYRLWLDPTMAYTCAYFATDQMSLHQAQIAKMDHVCRKLRLRSGDEVIEAGCGWGGLALHMASQYGAKVRAFNISSEQVAYARARAASAGLAGRVEYIHDDYRHIGGDADVFVSVGMLEHVGVENYTKLGGIVRRCLRPEGRGLIHTIGRDAPHHINRWIERHIFPGARIPSLGEMMRIFEPAGLSVLDVENLRPHYARTLACWLSGFEQVKGSVASRYGEDFVRTWELYLASSQAAFQAGDMQLFQVLFTPSRNSDIPRTREHLYRSTAAS
jgi:cyclopropane-fatty-acyl-phospholipid synthase